MPRLTRAKAAEIAEELHVDEDAVLGLPSDSGPLAILMKTPEPIDRKTLGEIAPNSTGSKEEGEVVDLKKSTRSRKGANKKGGKDDLASSTASHSKGRVTAADGHNGEPLDADMANPETSAVDTAFETLSDVPVETTRHLAKTDSTSLHTNSDPSAPTIDAPTSPLLSAMPNIIASLRKDTPGKRSTSNKENVEPVVSSTPSALTPRTAVTYDALEHAVVQAATPPGPSRRPSTVELPCDQATPAAEPSATLAEPGLAAVPVEAATVQLTASADSIDALDALEDALEKVSLKVPQVQRTPEKSKPKKAAPVVRTTKASLARLSMALAEKAGAADKTATSARPRPSTILGRSSSVRQSTTLRSEMASKRIPSGAAKKPDAGAELRENKEVAIPHSKPRPVSLSFPTPPPPPKSKKAPTSSTFQLPGEAVAAKLRAAREERMQKEVAVAEQKKAAFKARPVPAGLARAPSVRQTTASKARESLMGAKPTDASGPSAAYKRAQSAMAPGTTKPRAVSKDFAAPGASLRPPTSELKVSKRPSTAMANISKPRASNGLGDSAPAPIAGQRVPSGKGTSKGKEVFNRAAAAKEAAEKEKREKEGAAKKARVAASERGRQASREWAEKQKAKKVAAVGKVDASPKAKVDASEVSITKEEGVVA
ncbi:hypothetical protein LTR53_012844 [Teratosphaeriaceae sp. CCFEE 6253]|nr:hypothetical protein LTR53_012844 [Teratosphaeriaceae sp. CCFEE 6253]